MSAKSSKSALQSGLDELAGKLDFEAGKLASAVASQPKLYFQACRLRVQRTRARMKCELLLKAARADAALRARADSPGALTAQLVQAHVDSDETVQRLEEELLLRVAEEEEAKMLVEAFRQRRECLAVVLEQNLAEMGAGAVRAKLRAKYPGR
jgi:hypothetical protein